MVSLRLWSLVLTCCALACSRGDASPRPGNASTPGANAAQATAAPTVDSLSEAADRGRVIGAESAPLWLLVVSDFQCPWCKMWHDSTFPSLKREYVETGKLRVAYLNFPLGMHANAWPSALAAMCASAQGKFWETHDRIFQTQGTWEKLATPQPYLDSLAIAAGADAGLQHSCTAKRATLTLIQADQARAQKAGAETTPTFFVGRAKIEGAQPLALFRHVIDSILIATPKTK
jgi:protein-disulfide isomerase